MQKRKEMKSGLLQGTGERDTVVEQRGKIRSCTSYEGHKHLKASEDLEDNTGNKSNLKKI